MVGECIVISHETPKGKLDAGKLDQDCIAGRRREDLVAGEERRGCGEMLG